MHYTYHKRYHPSDVLVYIEEFNKEFQTVLFDFIDSNERDQFLVLSSINSSGNSPSMLLLNNYRLKNIRENTIYAIKQEVIISWRDRNLIINNGQNSFLIGYTVALTTHENQIFSESVSLNDFLDYGLHHFMRGKTNLQSLALRFQGGLTVTVRNVGQGNWNEINEDGIIKLVYDAGGPVNASKSYITNIIGNRTSIYSKEKPGLILSHWDKDHYHSLIGMSDAELANFSFFICRDRVPNLTSRLLFNRIAKAVGQQSTFTIPAHQRQARGGPTYLKPLISFNQIVIYNSQKHKNRNISGIAISIKTKKSSAILSGDCHYEQISRDILTHLNFKHTHHLIVPHHGGKAGSYTYKLPNLVTGGKAIISVGKNNYGHPMTQYTNALSKSFYVIKTQTKGRDITINL